MTILANRYNWNTLSAAERAEVLQRPAVAASAETVAGVKAILNDVRDNGDTAPYAHSRKNWTALPLNLFASVRPNSQKRVTR